MNRGVVVVSESSRQHACLRFRSFFSEHRVDINAVGQETCVASLIFDQTGRAVWSSVRQRRHHRWRFVRGPHSTGEGPKSRRAELLR